MKNLITVLWLLLILVFTALSGSPQAALLKTEISTLGAGSSDTLTISNVPIGGDSLGVSVEFDVDSISGELRYQYLSFNNKSDTTAFENLPVIVTIPTHGYTEISNAIPMKAGAVKLQYYLIITNDKASTQTVNTKIYTVLNR